MITVYDKVKKVAEECIKIKYLRTPPGPNEIKHAFVEYDFKEYDSFNFLGWIGSGKHSSIKVPPLVDNIIIEIANQLAKEQPSIRSSYPHKITDSRWNEIVRQCLGSALIIINMSKDLDTNADSLYSKLLDNLSNYSIFDRTYEYAFGCTLFENTPIKSFSIGPVFFEPKQEWLQRKKDENFVSHEIYARIIRKWDNKIVFPRPSLPRKIWLPKQLSLFRSKRLNEIILERDILQTVVYAPFVCSVRVLGGGHDLMKRGQTATQLAIASIAILWENPSLIIDGMNLVYDRRLYVKRALPTIPGIRLSAGGQFSHSAYGPKLEVQDWENNFKRHESYFEVIGEILDYITYGDKFTKRPKMINALSQSLFWFHEGCRDSTYLMANVKFISALEALACGRKSSGIIKLLSARLGIPKTQPLHENGFSIEDKVKELYGEGRSRTVHGTNPDLHRNWSGMSMSAEYLLRYAFLGCIEWAEKNPECDDPKMLST